LCARDYKGAGNEYVEQGKCIVETQPFTPSSFGNYSEGVGTLKRSGGDLGGGSETLLCENNIAHAFKMRGGCDGGGKGYLGKDKAAFTISTHQDQQIFYKMAIRRLTPMECERLQGFPDNYTNIKENCPDTPRYKALGNSMAVPVMRWIGRRIQIINQLK